MGVNLEEWQTFDQRKAYDLFRDVQPVVIWHKWVWSRSSLPKHRFIMWLMFRKKLQTATHLSKFTSISPICYLCKNEEEDIDHVIFKCHRVADLWGRICDWLKEPNYCISLQSLSQWLSSLKCSRVKKDIIYATVAASVYEAWGSRNLAIFQQRTKSSMEMWHSIVFQVCSRLNSIAKHSKRYIDWYTLVNH